MRFSVVIGCLMMYSTCGIRMQTTKKVPLVVIPGYGGLESRLAIIQANLEHMRENLGDFDCVLYLYKKVTLDSNRLKPCQIVDNLEQNASSNHSRVLANQVYQMARNEGGQLGELRLWTFWMKMVDRALVEEASHIFLLIDDVDITGIDAVRMLRTMTFNNVTTASPSVAGSEHPLMRPHPESVTGYHVNFLEPQFIVYSPENYKCWQDMIDLEVNPHGWGLDSCYQGACNPKMARIDNSGVAYHRGAQSTYDRSTALSEMNAYFAVHCNPKGWKVIKVPCDDTEMLDSLNFTS